MPIYYTTTFAFPSTAELLEVVDGKRPGALYNRTADLIAELEQALIRV